MRSSAAAQFELGNLRFDAGTFAAAIEHYRAAVAAKPDFASAWASLGAALERLDRLDEAGAAYERAVRIAPGSAELMLNIANLQRRVGRLDEALRALRQALALKPGLAPAHNNLAIVLRLLGRREDALAASEAALAFAPNEPIFHNTRGNVLEELGRAEAAVDAFDTALRLRPDFAEASANKAKSLMSLGRWDEASACHDAWLARHKADRLARYGRALIKLARGRFRSGWEDYLARPGTVALQDVLQRTPFAAELAGTRFVVVADQGLGDTLFFLRYAPLLRARGAYIALRPDKRLAGMIDRARIADRVLGPDEPAFLGAITIADGDLPYLLGMGNGDALPPANALAPLADRAREIAQRLAVLGPPPYIGVTWRGGTKARAETLYKEVPLDALARAIAPVAGTVLVLQRNPEPGEIERFVAALGRKAHDLSPLNDDLEDMLALLAVLDDYVAVSNTNVHLREGAGRPSRVLVPLPPEFRWMAAGEESPWFPGTHIYRERLDRDWTEAMARLAADLARSAA